MRLLARVSTYGVVKRLEAWVEPRGRERELRYRAERDEAAQGELARLAEADAGAMEALTSLHRVLNSDKPIPALTRLAWRLRGDPSRPGLLRTGSITSGPYLPPAGDRVPRLVEAFTARLDGLVAQARTREDAAAVSGWAMGMVILLHAFRDGNGRSGRALVNWIEDRAGSPRTAFPADNEAFKASPVWSGVKRWVTATRAELGWDLKQGVRPPPGYHDRLEALLLRDLRGATLPQLRERPEVQAIARALLDGEVAR